MNRSESVFVISEWLPKPGKDQELWQQAKKLVAAIRKEKGCLRAHALRQLIHPASPGKSKYTTICTQEYRDIDAFDAHCAHDHVAEFFQNYVQNEESSLVEEWTCRLFNEP